MSTIKDRLAQLGHTLPPVKVPAANYLSYVQQNNMLFIAGQIGRIGITKSGAVDAGLTIEAARAEAEIAALNLLSAIDAAVMGNVDRIVQVIRLGVFIATTPKFDAHGVVANGASDLIVAVLGDRGRHARTAIGVSSLPSGAAVEIDAIVQIC